MLKIVIISYKKCDFVLQYFEKVGKSMKLKKFKERNRKQFGIIVFTITCILLVAGVVFYRTFAIFEVKTNQNVIKGTVQDPGNLYFAYYQMNENNEYEIQKEMPSKDAGYRLDTKTSYCGVNGEKDPNIAVSMTNDWIVQVKGMTTSRTKCNLYFKKGENFVKYIQNLSTQEENSGISGLYLVDHNTANITWEGTTEQVNNLKLEERRYAGKNYDETSNPTDYVHNYVNIDGQVWRVIGLVNTPEGQRIKLVKQDSIGNYSWYSSASNVNNGYGINEWSESNIMKLLNYGYDRNEVENSDGIIQKNDYINNSLYWNHENGTCYNGEANATISCEFKNNGIPSILKEMIETITWNTGSNESQLDYNKINAHQFYEIERSNTTGKNCQTGIYCNDIKERTITWKGKVGLIYPSDYGYATIGGGSDDRNQCLDLQLGYGTWDKHSDCYENDWLYTRNDSWMISPGAFGQHAYRVFNIRAQGFVYSDGGNAAKAIYPSVYLSTSVLLVTGDGSFDNMFRLSL